MLQSERRDLTLTDFGKDAQAQIAYKNLAELGKNDASNLFLTETSTIYTGKNIESIN